jgi:hypothetical protein
MPTHSRTTLSKKIKPIRTSRRPVSADARARAVILHVCDRAFGIVAALVWLVLGVLFVLWVVLKATSVGITEVVRTEWRDLHRRTR